MMIVVLIFNVVLRIFIQLLFKEKEEKRNI